MTTPIDNLALADTAKLNLPRLMDPLVQLKANLDAEEESLRVLVRQCPDKAEKDTLAKRLEDVWVQRHGLSGILTALRRVAVLEVY